MNDNEVEVIKKQHFDSYKNSILCNLENNSSSLFNEDIYSLIKKPPLDSMDTIKNKFLEISKKNKLVLDNDKLNKVLEVYRNNIIENLSLLSNKRINYFSNKIDIFERKDDSTIIKILKKDFIDFDKIINKELKSIINENINYIKSNLENIFGDNYNNKIENVINKYLKKDYFNSLFENIDIKIMVKDATLLNIINEETDRYKFTLENSRLFK